MFCLNLRFLQLQFFTILLQHHLLHSLQLRKTQINLVHHLITLLLLLLQLPAQRIVFRLHLPHPLLVLSSYLHYFLHRHRLLRGLVLVVYFNHTHNFLFEGLGLSLVVLSQFRSLLAYLIKLRSLLLSKLLLLCSVGFFGLHLNLMIIKRNL